MGHMTLPVRQQLRFGRPRLDHWDRLEERYRYFMDIGSWIAKGSAA